MMIDNQLVQFCEVVIAIFAAVVTGTFVLKVSCVLYNVLAGATGKRSGAEAVAAFNPEARNHGEEAAAERTAALPGVPIPTFEWALRIIFFATLINTSGSFIILRFVRLAGLAARGTVNSVPIVLISSPCGILVLGGLCASMLPCRFFKGLLVSLLFHLFAGILAAAIILTARAAGVSIPWLS